MGLDGWAVTVILGIGLAAAALAWPLALANHDGHHAWWGWPLEVAWLIALPCLAKLSRAAAARNAHQ